MRRPVLAIAGVVFVLVGGVWTLQGLGYLPGSVMSGVTFWAVAGPVVALFGLILVVRGLSRRGQGRPPTDDGSGGGDDTGGLRPR